MGCYPAGHCQKMGVCSAVLSTYQTKTKTTTKAVCPDPDTGMSHGRHPTQIPGKSMPPTVGAGMGQSYQTLQPKQELPPYQQSVMPQKAVISHPPPRAVEEAQKIAQAATMQAVESAVPMDPVYHIHSKVFPNSSLPIWPHRLDQWRLL